MPRPTTIVPGPARAAGPSSGSAPVDLEQALRALMTELEVPGDFPADVLAEAQRAATSPDLPTTDWTDLPFVTVDPPGATDLDQAVHLSRSAGGYRVRYAIADVGAFVRPGGAVDAEARRRGQTLYAPHTRVPLHPPVLGEGAASLLPGQVRPAFVWVVDLDADGETRAVDVVRALVRSREQLTYEQVQAAHDAGTPAAPLELLPEVGRSLTALEAERGGSGVAVPDQEVVPAGDGYVLRYRPARPVEDWNAQVSLLTGMAAADLMLAGGVGVLRTMPAPDERTTARFRRQAAALGHPWPAEQRLGDFLRTLDVEAPSALALVHASTTLFRGAGYTPFDGAVPEHVVQAAVAAEYAHVTAPLRRLVDRFGLAVCEALCRGREVPGWVREALPTLPAVMAGSDRRAGQLERAGVDLAEAVVLAGQVGRELAAVVVDVDDRDEGTRGQVQLVGEGVPAVLAPVRSVAGRLPLGERVPVRLVEADPATRRVRFETT